MGASLSADFPGGAVVKNLPVDARDKGGKGSILGQEDPLEKGMAIHSSILAWKILQRRLAGDSPRGHKESARTEQQSLHTLMSA